MIKILHIRSTTGFYGAEKVIYNIFSNISSEPVALSLITIENEEPSSRTLRIKLKEYNVKKLLIPKKYDREAINLLSLHLNENKIDIVHTHDYKSLFYAIASIKKNRNIKLVHHLHGSLNNTLAEKFYSLLEKHLINRADLVFVVSEAQKKMLSDSFLVRNMDIFYLQNGTEVKNKLYRNTDLDKHSIHISVVARFTPEKNHLLAINVIKILSDCKYKFSLHLYGDGPLLNDIKEKVAEYNLQNIVIFHGYCADVSEIYDVTDILLITSTTEGLPMVLLEAMSNGIPVVSTDVGQISEVVKNNQSGFITPIKANDLVSKVKAFFDTPGLLQRMGCSSHSIIKEKFSIHSQIVTLNSYYQQLVRYGSR